MDLFFVHGMRLLLDACAETLETLRLYPNDPRGEELFPERRGNRWQLTISQLGFLLRTLISREANRFENSRSRRNVLGRRCVLTLLP